MISVLGIRPRRDKRWNERPIAFLELFDVHTMEAVEWRKVMRLPDYTHRKLPPAGPGPLQERLFA
jgi:hypothetical protein